MSVYAELCKGLAVAKAHDRKVRDEAVDFVSSLVDGFRAHLGCLPEACNVGVRSRDQTTVKIASAGEALVHDDEDDAWRTVLCLQLDAPNESPLTMTWDLVIRNGEGAEWEVTVNRRTFTVASNKMLPGACAPLFAALVQEVRDRFAR